MRQPDPPPLPQPTGGEPCRRNPEQWFPTRGQAYEVTVLAKRLCREECPLVEKCLAYAMAYKVDGIWGGTSRNERTRMRKRVKAEALPVVPYFDFRKKRAS